MDESSDGSASDNVLKPPRGRPSLGQTESAKKRKTKQSKKLHDSKRKNMKLQMWMSSESMEDFNRIKLEMGFSSNGIVLDHLLDTYKVHKECVIDESTTSELPSEVFQPLPGLQFRAPDPVETPSKRMRISTPSTSRILHVSSSSLGGNIATGARPTSSISGGSTSAEEREVISDVEPISPKVPVRTDEEVPPSMHDTTLIAQIDDDEEPLSDQNQADVTTTSIKSGKWDVTLHEEMLPTSADITKDLSMVDDPQDESYFPSIPGSFDSMGLEDYEDLVNELLENVIFTFNPADDEIVEHPHREKELVSETEEDEETDEDEESPTRESVGNSCFVKVTNYADHKDEKTTFAYSSCLKELAALTVPTECRHCKGPLQLQEKQIGTALLLKWVCDNKQHKVHIEKQWCSQPRFKFGACLGDFMLACGILFSGNQFAKIAVLLGAVNMKPMAQNLFYKVTSMYANQAVNTLWEDVQSEILEECDNEDGVVVLGDGRMDSPGFSAEYCTYTSMDNRTKNILDVTIINKRQTGLNSVTMEREGCRKALDSLTEKGVNIIEMATDQHSQISSMMAKEYEHIFHSLDVWHGAKNLGKRIVKAGTEAGCKPLLPWTRDIINHFWYCVKITEDSEEFVEKWRGTIHHVVDDHSWYGHITEDNPTGYTECDHQTIETARDDKEWLEEESKAHKKVRDLVLDPKLLKNVPKFLKFRNTSLIETFNSKILAYAPKRISYRPPAYKARCLLAALDYQYNKDRQIAMTKTGETRLQRRFNKRSKRWDAYALKEKKSYDFIDDLMTLAVTDRISNPDRMKKQTLLHESDPRKIMPRLSMETPEPTRDIFEKKESRL